MTSTAPPGERRRVPPLAAFVEGWRRVFHAPVVIIGMVAIACLSWHLAAMAAALPAGVLTVTAQLPARGWMLLIETQLRGIVMAVAPELAPLVGATPVPSSWIAVWLAYAALWMFLSGGLMDRLARGRMIGTAAFFAACGVHCFRFLRLAALIAIVGWPLWRWQVLASGPRGRLVVLMLVGLISVLWDFARVRTVVEDRHSMIGAVTAAIRFVRRRLWRVLGLSFFNGLAVLVVWRVSFQIATTPVTGWWSVGLSIGWLTLAVMTRLAIIASKLVFFQGELAHAGYTAAPLPVWPDSPAAEAIDNLVARS